MNNFICCSESVWIYRTFLSSKLIPQIRLQKLDWMQKNEEEKKFKKCLN